jgi:hypothetical protein
LARTSKKAKAPAGMSVFIAVLMRLVTFMVLQFICRTGG